MKKHTMHPLASMEGVSRHFIIGTIIETQSGSVLSFDQLIEQLQTKDLVFIGEVHDNPEHHLIQVQILQALMMQQPITVAMEFFQKPQQPIIDQYFQGKLTEAEFLKNVHWRQGWSFDYSLYRPLILEIKARGGNLLAINAPNNIVRKVAKSGLSSLESKERSHLAKNIDLEDEKHRAYIQEVFKDEAHNKLINFNFFYEAQCVWEDTMAENIAKSLEGANGPLVALSGNGHIVNKFGIPNRVVKRIPADMATVLLLPLEGKTTIDKESADFVWLTGKYSRRSLSFMHHHK